MPSIQRDTDWELYYLQHCRGHRTNSEESKVPRTLWQGPPHINKVTQKLCRPLRSVCAVYSVMTPKRVCAFRLFRHSISLKKNHFHKKTTECSFKQQGDGVLSASIKPLL